MRVAGMPVIFSAHAGVLVGEGGRELVEADGAAVEELAIVELLDQSMWQSARIIAASVLGRIASHSTSPPVSRSSAVGVTLTKRTPLARMP